MISTDIDEAAAIMIRALSNLLGTMPSTVGTQGAAVRRACGDLTANAPFAIRDATAPADLANCFELARQAGATFDLLDRMRLATEAERPATVAAVVIAVVIIRFALIEQSRILAATVFKSRDEIDRYMVRVRDAFYPSETFAADIHDTINYRALVALHAAVTNDLATRALPLPRVVAYSFAQRMPALWIANRLYGDATREQEIIDQNKPVHPAFMTPTGNVLSA
jgi:prophage DNA circulation protein